MPPQPGSRMSHLDHPSPAVRLRQFRLGSPMTPSAHTRSDSSSTKLIRVPLRARTDSDSSLTRRGTRMSHMAHPCSPACVRADSDWLRTRPRTQ
eukprot:3319133-Alexandrium_andersonii.AAC.1